MISTDKKAMVTTLLVLLCSSMVFVWVLTSEDPGEELQNSGNAFSRSRKLSRAVIPNRKRHITGSATGAAARLTQQPDTRLIFGNTIRSGSARAVFRIVDKLHQPLDEDACFRGRLLRKVGPYWLKESVHHDEQNNVIICAGHVGCGLESGEYKLMVHSPSYGNAKISFTIAHGQVIHDAIALPHWKRRIRLRLVGSDGEPLSFIRRTVYYIPPRTSRAFTDELFPERVFGDLPDWYNPYETAMDSWGETGIVSHFTPLDNGRFMTPGGLLEFDVFAGGEGQLVQEQLPGDKGRPQISVHSDFTEAAWDNYVIRLPRTAQEEPEQKEAITQSTLTFSSTPWVPGIEFDPDDPSTIHKSVHRVVFAHTHTSQLQLCSNGPPENLHDVLISPGIRWPTVTEPDCPSPPLNSKEADFLDLPHGKSSGIRYWYTDGALLRTPERTLGTGDDLPLGTSSHVMTHITASDLSITTALPTPTSRAWARGACIAWKDMTIPSSQRLFMTESDQFHIDTAIVASSEESETTANEMSILFHGDGNGSNQLLSGHLSPVHESPSGNREYRLKVTPRGIIARAVNKNGEGIPWVEAALVAMDQIPASMSLRMRQRNWRREERPGRPYSEETKLKRSLSWELRVLADSSECREANGAPLLSDSEVRGLLPHGLYEELDNHEEREFLALNRNWYNPEMRVHSDTRGYIKNDWSNSKLTPGRRYKLFLWSRSRDHLSPDKSVVFTMTEGLKDLGAILMPDYE